MTDWLLLNLTNYGYSLLFVTTFLSCLALPVPASLAMMTAGAFAASGDLILWATASSALGGAVAGDQTGFLLGRVGSSRMSPFFVRHRGRAKLISRARRLTDQYGGPGIFLSRWLVSPLGPYANFVSGATHYQWHRFTLWGISGELVWVLLYTSLGYIFAANIDLVAQIAADTSGLIAASAMTVGIGLYLIHAMNRHAKRRKD